MIPSAAFRLKSMRFHHYRKIWNSILGKITKKGQGETCRAQSPFYITENKDEIEISKDGTFKIMQITDMQGNSRNIERHDRADGAGGSGGAAGSCRLHW